MEKKEKDNLLFSNRRVLIVNALNAAIDIFTSHSEKEFDDVISKALKTITDAAGLDRVVFYRNLNVNGEIRFGQIYCWDKEKEGLISLDEELRIIPKIPVFDKWILTLTKGDCIRIRESDMSKDELAFLREYGVKSILIIPIFSHGDFWGAVALQDHTHDFYFDDGCTDLLFSAARMCANAIIRAEMSNNANKAVNALKRREKMANMLNRAAVTFLSQSQESFESMMTDGVRFIADMLDLDRISIWRNFKTFDVLHSSQIYRWDREAGGTTVPTEFFKDVTYDQLAPRWEDLLAKGNTINSPARLLPESEAAMLESFGVVSVFITPVILNNIFWGFVFFEDRLNERFFEDDLAEIMQSAAFLCANTVIRADMETLLKSRLEQQELISEISRSFVSSDETQNLINDAIAKLGNYYKVSKVTIFYIDYKSGDTDIAYQWSADKNPINRGKFNMHNLIKTRFPQRLYDTATVPIISCPDIKLNNFDEFKELFCGNVNAFICAPLYVEGLVWGLLTVEQFHNPRQWTDNEKNFIAMSTSTIAGAIMLDVYNTKLKDAVTKVTAASKAKSEFLSNMSHEMRTPMNAIINMTLIAKDTSDMERKTYALDKIGDASTHLLGVINDILDMSKIEANKFELMPVEFNFEKMIERVFNVINFRVEEKHQTLKVNIDKKIPKMLIGDDQRITQIITNLLSNSVKFTPENGIINLETRFIKIENEICTIQISVTDTGIGISKEHQKNLFQSFQQAESNTARNYGGTGLGLSISKSFVEMMGGNIWVESKPGKGSTFSFSINVKYNPNNNEQKNEEDQIEEINKNDSNNFTGHRILLAEDMEINREIVLMLLESTQLEIDCAVNGIQAVEMFIDEPQRYEMIFMDVHMPGMDGYEATRQIRIYEEKLKEKNRLENKSLNNISTSFTEGETRRNPLQRIPIVAMTANVFKEDIRHCMEAGMDDHVGKPLDIEIVLKKLKHYLLRAG